MLNSELCPCESGLRHVRCCGLDAASLPGAEAHALLNPKGEEAVRLFNEKNYAGAIAVVLPMLELAPNHRMALRVLFEIRRAEGNAKAAEALGRRLAAQPVENPAQAAAPQLQLAQMLVGQGRHMDAEPAAAAAVKLTPRDATAHHVLGVIMTETGRFTAGEAHYRLALGLLEQSDGMVLANLAWNLKLQGRLDEAAAVYERALLIRPDNMRGIGGFAQVEAGRGRLDHAAALLDEALTTTPGDRTLRLLRALVDLQRGDAQAVLDRLNDSPDVLLPPEFAARGQAFARMGLVQNAVAHYAKAKFILRERNGRHYDAAAISAKAAAYKAYFTSNKLLNMPRVPSFSGPQPVFLLGFPRSGTSLLEQMLAKVTGFSAADKAAPVARLPALLERLANGDETYPQVLDETLAGEGRVLTARLRDDYFRQLRDSGVTTPATHYVTDRAADNYWHLGLIKLLFPEAVILHVLRHPLDVMLSNLAQDVKLEADCGVGMVALAQHYDATMSMIRHYRGQLTLRYMPVRYEDLVAEPTASLAAVLEFIGVDRALMPPEAVLRENARQTGAHQPGYAVMQERLYTRSRFLAAEYERELPALFSEVRPILNQWIDELGYHHGAGMAA